MGQIKKAVILGNHIQALGLSRMASRIGLQVTIYNSYGASVARFSNSCSKFILYRDQEHLLQMLLDGKVEKEAILLATNDDLIGFMARHFEALTERYYLSIPKPEVVDICFNKRKTYRRAQEMGIPIPETHFPDSLEEVRALAPTLQYPVILKPAIMFTFFGATGQKVFFCADEQELIRQYEEILKIIPAEEVIVQQFLHGGAPTLYSFGSFFAGGEVYGSFVANRIRQKPMDFGISTCFARTVLNPEIERQAIDFLRGIDYFGMSEVEFMYDQATGEYRLIEINPRSWKWHSIANKLEIHLLEMMVDYLENKPVARKVNDQADVGWVERLTDTYVVAGELWKRRMTLSEYLRTMRMPKESATWSLRDPLPAIMYVLMSPYLLLKRN